VPARAFSAVPPVLLENGLTLAGLVLEWKDEEEARGLWEEDLG